ncbi:phosphotransferase family protein [Bradyrhizobium manausense]|uniref:phosphotransferase family protein n=1 Tax=Bradyrhizobium manausense TaxID=989370 RepID=UPI001BA7299B|nr:phosphotransferase family protein [Bradyrhizobium manausense]MBR0684342.1 phosphotransferase family protein [Bradyrhizobium manausense]
MSDEPWKDLVDLNKVCAWMDRVGLGSGAIEDPTPLAGGTQNVLLLFYRDGRPFVLRRSPRHPRGDGNATNRREARVLGALASTDVPHPRLIAACSSEEVIGAAFYLMEPIDGFNATVMLPPLHASDRSVRREMGFALVDGALALGRVDHMAVGLGDFGKSDGFLERQVPRWRALLDSYRDYEGWPGAGSIPGLDQVAKWLADHVPPSFTPGLMHGDYHLANVMFRKNGPELAAIVDWELATIGDPLLDMGWIIATWPGVDGHTIAEFGIKPWGGFPSIGDLVDRYREGSQRDTTHIRWYGVLACYKLGVILEGTYARACAGAASKITGQRLHQSCIKLFERAQSWLESDRLQ